MRYFFIEPRENMQQNENVIVTPLEQMMYNGFGTGIHPKISKLTYSERIKFLYPDENLIRENINSFIFYYNVNDSCENDIKKQPLHKGILFPRTSIHCSSLAFFVTDEGKLALEKSGLQNKWTFLPVPRKNIILYDYNYSESGFAMNGDSTEISLAKAFSRKKKLDVTSNQLYDGSLITKYYKKYKVKQDRNVGIYLCFLKKYNNRMYSRFEDEKLEIKDSDLLLTGDFLLNEFTYDDYSTAMFLSPKKLEDSTYFAIKAGLGIIVSEYVYKVIEGFLPDLFFIKKSIENITR